MYLLATKSSIRYPLPFKIKFWDLTSVLNYLEILRINVLYYFIAITCSCKKKQMISSQK